MDIELLRTFLEVSRLRHFGRAGDKLHITQSAVSVRIRQLEESLGVSLLTRNRNNIQLTPDGQRLKTHAETIVNTWVRACQETGLGPEYSSTLALGATWDLWDIFLNKWLIGARRDLPGIALQIESHAAETLARKLLDGLLDLVLTFDPPQLADMEIREVAVIKLVMVSTRQGQAVSSALASNYIMVDWGTQFALNHARHFPEAPAPAIRMSQGALAFSYLMAHDGAAYLAEQSLRTCVGDQRLFRVKQAPVLERTAYAVYRPDAARDTGVQTAITLLKTC
jgi:DNA-binding transcriptional LysR family regulator